MGIVRSCGGRSGFVERMRRAVQILNGTEGEPDGSVSQLVGVRGQSGVSGERSEIGVGVEDRHVDAHGDGCD